MLQGNVAVKEFVTAGFDVSGSILGSVGAGIELQLNFLDQQKQARAWIRITNIRLKQADHLSKDKLVIVKFVPFAGTGCR